MELSSLVNGNEEILESPDVFDPDRRWITIEQVEKKLNCKHTSYYIFPYPAS